MSEREIKFRVFGWDCDKSKWELNPFGYDRLNLDGAIEHDDSFVAEDIDEIFIEQYTGLKDAQGVEIYEGDILEHRYRFEDTTVMTSEFGKVIWKNDGWFVNSGVTILDPLSTWVDMIVVGNIHENEDLMER